MDLREAVKKFVSDTKYIIESLRTEGETLSRVDLHILEVQLYLLQKEVAKWKEQKHPNPKPSPSSPLLPPFTSAHDQKKK